MSAAKSSALVVAFHAQAVGADDSEDGGGGGGGGGGGADEEGGGGGACETVDIWVCIGEDDVADELASIVVDEDIFVVE